VGSKTYAPVARTQVSRLRRDLDALVARCESLAPGTDIESDAYQYAYVRLCGLLEQALLLAARDLVNKFAVAEARQFGLSQLQRSSQNPKDEVILRFVKRFNDSWAYDLADWFETDDRGGTVNALVGIRNGIAHGTSFSGSRTRFDHYYVVTYELIDWILDRFAPV
jgi:hypothetical protein